MTTLDEVGELWCALWMRELERGTTPRQYGYWEPELITPEMLVEVTAAGITLIFSADRIRGERGHTLELADDNGRVPDFTLEIAGGAVRGSVAAYNCATAANPWGDAAAGMRALLEAA